MSNATKTYGFVPYGSMDSKGYGGIRAYYIPATDSHAVGIGDVVTRTLGMNASAINGHPAGTLPNAAVNYADVTTATAITGVVVGLEPINPFDSMAAQGAASTARVAYVMIDTDAVFKVCAESGQTVNVGGNAGFDYIAPTNGRSNVTLKATATTQGLPFKVVGVVTDPYASDATEYLVKINNSTEMDYSTAINS
ncbi:MAG: hypothetical protein J6U92_07770 [Clostridia bacterium]|nr:hypothetical protein [Clostridia bacterium]